MRYLLTWQHEDRAKLFVVVNSHDELRGKVDTILKYPHAPLNYFHITALVEAKPNED